MSIHLMNAFPIGVLPTGKTILAGRMTCSIVKGPSFSAYKVAELSNLAGIYYPLN